MKKSNTILILAIVFLLCAFPQLSTAGESEPSYEGKKLSHWIKELKKKDTQRVNKAIKALAAIGEPAVSKLTPLLEDKKYSVKNNAVSALLKLGPAAKEAVPFLITMLGDPDSGELRYNDDGRVVMTFGNPEAKKIRLLVITTLANIGAGAMPGLIAGLKHNNQLVRLGSVQAIESIGAVPDQATDLLLELLKDKHPHIRASAGRLLTRSGSEIVPQLLVLLKSSDTEAKLGAMEVLGQFKSAAIEAIPALHAALFDADRNVRVAAAETLGKVGPLTPQVIKSLGEMLSDESEAVQLASAIALARNQVKDAVPVLLKTLQHKSSDSTKIFQAIDSLTRQSDSEALPIGGLMNQIVEKSAVKDAVRAAEALGIMGAMAEEAIPALIQAEQHKSLEVRQEAAKALTKIYAAIEELD